jgi:hypothetical protein
VGSVRDGLDDQDRTRRRTYNLLGGAAVQDTIESAAAVRADHDQVAVLLGRSVNDGVHRGFFAQQVLNLDLWIDRGIASVT